MNMIYNKQAARRTRGGVYFAYYNAIGRPPGLYPAARLSYVLRPFTGLY